MSLARRQPRSLRLQNDVTRDDETRKRECMIYRAARSDSKGDVRVTYILREDTFDRAKLDLKNIPFGEYQN